MATKTITMKDIAERAGVSQPLVSAALSGKKSTVKVAPETAERIRLLATEMGYIPSRAASSLKNQQSLGLISVSMIKGYPYHSASFDHPPDYPLPPWVPMDLVLQAQGAEEHYTHGGLVEVAKAAHDQAGEIRVVSYGRDESSTQPFTPADLGLDLCDGIIYGQLTTYHTEIVNYAENGYPVVFRGHFPETESIYSVGIDRHLAAQQLTEHLIDQGRRRILAVMPYDQHSHQAFGRMTGVCNTIQQHGLTMAGSYYLGGNPGVELGYSAMREILENGVKFDGVIVGTNYLARGVVYALKECDIKIPDDVAVVTFDDGLINILDKPELTCVRIPHDLVSYAALNMLLGLINGEPPAERHIMFETQLIIRASSQV